MPLSPSDKQDSSEQTLWPQSHVLLRTVAVIQPLQYLTRNLVPYVLFLATVMYALLLQQFTGQPLSDTYDRPHSLERHATTQRNMATMVFPPHTPHLHMASPWSHVIMPTERPKQTLSQQKSVVPRITWAMMAMSKLPICMLHTNVVQCHIRFDALHSKILAIPTPNLIFHPVISKICYNFCVNISFPREI